MFNGTSFGFVNSHLTSGSEKKLRWDQWHRVLNETSSSTDTICMVAETPTLYSKGFLILSVSQWIFFVCRRNQNYVSILRFLNLGDKKLNPFDITHRFTHLIWLGDLNYRVDLPSSVRFPGHVWRLYIVQEWTKWLEWWWCVQRLKMLEEAERERETFHHSSWDDLSRVSSLSPALQATASL